MAKRSEAPAFPLLGRRRPKLRFGAHPPPATRRKANPATGRRLRFEPLELRLALDSTVVFNEIMYNPAGPGESLEWLELHNQMAVDMDVSGWSIRDAVGFQFAEGTLIPGGSYLVVAKDPDLLQTETGFAQALGPYAGQLSNGGERIELVNNNDRLMDSLEYDDDEPWPVTSDGSGASLAKIDPFSTSGPAENWTESDQLGGTPGAINFPTSLVPIETKTVLAIDAPWKYEASGTDLGTAWREPGFGDGGWGSARALLPSVLITEVSTATDDYVEIQNVSEGPADTSGWAVAANNASSNPPNINEVHATTWALPDSIPAGEVLYRTDDENDVGHYWGENLWWRTTGNGWAMIVDDAGSVVDFVVWGYRDAEIASLRVNVNGFDVTADNAWNRAAVPAEGRTNNTLRRSGNVDHDDASDWAFSTPPSQGIQNADLTTPFAATMIALTPGRTTYYFRTEFDLDDVPAQAELSLDTIVDDGAVFYLNGVEVYRQNMPPGEVTYDTLTSTEVRDASFTYDVSLPVGSLIEGANLLAVEVHQAAPNDVDMLFGARLTATVWPPGSLDIDLAFNEVAAASEPQFWLELANYGDTSIQLDGYIIAASAVNQYVFPAQSIAPDGFVSVAQAELGFGAAPGDKLFLYPPDRSGVLDAVRVDNILRGRSPDGTGRWLYPDLATHDPPSANHFAFHDEIVINEIMYHAFPQLATESLPFEESPEEWIELYNRSRTTVDLTGWTLQDAIDLEFPAGTTIDPGEYLVVARDAEMLRAKYPGIEIVGDFSRRLSDRNDRILLVDANRNPADEVRYYEDRPWPAYADGGGSSLELRDPDADNSKPETWAASVEGTRSAWYTITYRGVARKPPGSNDPTTYHEFHLGLLEAGEVLLDEITVIQDPDGAARQLIQNSSFESGTTDKWRILGNHHGFIVADPDDPGNQVLRLLATGPTEHLQNHAETTLKDGSTFVPIQLGAEYEISLRAKWLGGSNQLNTRLFFNFLPKTTLLEVPEISGTPGAQNSVSEVNIGPTYSELRHAPLVPEENEPVTVSVIAEDPDGVTGMRLWYSTGGAWSSAPMTAQEAATAAGGLYVGTIPGYSRATVVQFYVEGEDDLGAKSAFPPGGADSRALLKVKDGMGGVNGLSNMRIIVTSADTALLGSSTNLMSNDRLGATVVSGDKVFYDVGVRLKGSEHGRPDLPRRGFSVKFHADNLFRGVHETIGIDRSGGWRFGRHYGQDEILIYHIFNHAGDIPSMYSDLVYVDAPTVPDGTAILQLARHNDVYLDSQFKDGSKGTEFEYELIYTMVLSNPGDRESLKRASEGPSVFGVPLRSLGEDKEAYRHYYLIKNNRTQDDYGHLIEMAQTFSLSGSGFHERAAEVLDVDQWLRAFAAMSLIGAGDNYSTGAQHNAVFYTRPEDQKTLLFPWDMDFAFVASQFAPLSSNADLNKLISLPANRRLFYGHLYDIIQTSYNTAYMSDWVAHYDSLLPGQNLSSILAYIDTRANYVLGQLPAEVPFVITTNDGNDFSVPDAVVTIEGNGWINVRQIHLGGSDDPLQVTWTDADSWQVAVPLASGPNLLTFRAFDFQGNPVGADSITVTSTAPDRPLQEFLRISELNYHPYDPTPAEQAAGFTDENDFEFIELQNIGDQPLELTGVRFTEGIDFTFSSGTRGSPVLITEASTATEDYVEIQNISEGTANTSGWVVAVNNAENDDINEVHSILWSLPGSMTADEVLYRTDNDQDLDHYWGESIWWMTSGNGWAMIVDDAGNVADFVVWGYSASEIASLSVHINGFDVTVGGAWHTAAVPAEGSSRPLNSLQRSGSSDHDNASDWAFVSPQTQGTQNPGLTTPFTGEIELDSAELIVLVRNVAAFQRRYGTGISVAGRYSRKLDNDGERVKLEDPAGGTILDFEYHSSDDWPGRASGKGASLEVIETDGDYNNSNNWRSSSEYGGSPGRAGTGPVGDVLVNEVLTHTNLPLLDTIELVNTTDDPINIGGWYLSDDWGWDPTGVDGNYKRFRVPDGTSIAAHAYLVFDEDDFNPRWNDPQQEPGPNDFALSGAHGDDVWLMEADQDGRLTRFVDHVEFGAAPAGESWGRWPNGEGDLYPMVEPTLGSENLGPRVGPVIISEVHYNPNDTLEDDDLEFVEIYNPTSEPLDLTNWRIRGGIDYDFPAPATLDAYSALIVVPFGLGDGEKLAAFYDAYWPGGPVPQDLVILGAYFGQLNDTGGKVQLQRPDEPPLLEPWFIPRLLEDEVRYDDQRPWPTTPDGGGASLKRTQADAWGNIHQSWEGLPPTPGFVEFPAEVVGRHIFYNNSAFDGHNAAANAQDDNAIAPDKEPLMPGIPSGGHWNNAPPDGRAAFANYTSYSRGINGIFVDIEGLLGAVPPGVVPTADDFQFRVGNDDDPTGWPAGPPPSLVTVRPGAGVYGSDRVTMIWADNAIEKQWLQVTVLATAQTGLPEEDVFYFGNAVGETGDSTTDAKVNIFDMLGTRDNQRTFLNPAPVDFRYDFNRDQRVNTYDMLIARDNQTHFLNALKLITPPSLTPLEGSGYPPAARLQIAEAEDVAESENRSARDAVFEQTGGQELRHQQTSLGKLDWLYEFEQTSANGRPSGRDNQVEEAVDILATTY